MSETPTPETDAYIMQSYSPTGLQWRCFARKLERERDEARRDLDASEELHRRRFGTLRKELAASNLGAERNAKVNQGLCAKLAEAERERDEARMERDEALAQKNSVFNSIRSAWFLLDNALEGEA